MVLSPDKAKKMLAHSGWLLCHLSSHCRLSPACASASHCTAASHCAPLTPLVQLVVALPLVTLPSPNRLRLRLSLHRHLLLCPSCASCQAGCCVASGHTAVSRLPALPPLIAPAPIIAPLLHLLSGWLLRHLSTRRHPPSACVSASHRASCPASCCITYCHAATSTSHCTAASHHTPLVPLIQLVVVSPLVTPPPPVCLRLHLSAHHRLIPRPPHNKRRESLTPLIWLVVALPLVTLLPPVLLCLRLSLHRQLSSHPSHASCPAGCCVASHHAATSHPPAPPPLITPPPLIAPLLCLLSGWYLHAR
jgi:hypothetical protein